MSRFNRREKITLHMRDSIGVGKFSMLTKLAPCQQQCCAVPVLRSGKDGKRYPMTEHVIHNDILSGVFPDGLPRGSYWLEWVPKA